MPPTGDIACAASPMQSRPGDASGQAVDLDGKEFDLIPGGDFGDAIGEDGCDTDDALVEGWRPAAGRGQRCLC